MEAPWFCNNVHYHYYLAGVVLESANLLHVTPQFDTSVADAPRGRVCEIQGCRRCVLRNVMTNSDILGLDDNVRGVSWGTLKKPTRLEKITDRLVSLSLASSYATRHTLARTQSKSLVKVVPCEDIPNFCCRG